jgi:hypothetical protein
VKARRHRGRPRSDCGAPASVIADAHEAVGGARRERERAPTTRSASRGRGPTGRPWPPPSRRALRRSLLAEAAHRPRVGADMIRWMCAAPART